LSTNDILDQAFHYIHENFNRFVNEFKDLLRVPSIVGTHGVVECAKMVEEFMTSVGINVEVSSIEHKAPIVFGRLEPGSDGKTLLLYCHYDVYPVSNVHKWINDPFKAETVNGKIIARGTSDSKGNLMALLKAVESLSFALKGRPCCLKFVIGGDEEAGSPSLPQFIEENQGKLSANAAIIFDATLDEDNTPAVNLGREKPTSTEDDIVQAIIKASKTVYGTVPKIYRSVMTYPMYLISKKLGIKSLSTGCGSFNGNTHSINECITIDEFRNGIKYATSAIYFYTLE